MATEFVYKRRVQFAETDLAGIVHFSWYFRYMEEAEHAMWRSLGMSIVAPGHEVGFPRVAATCDYMAPLRFEDEVDVQIIIEALNRRTIKYRCTLVRGTTTVATGSMTTACVDKRPGEPLRAIEVPAEIADRFRAADLLA